MAHFKRLVRITFGALFVVIGVLHFVRPAPFVAIVPPYLPWPAALVLVSGAAEIMFGVLLLFRGTMAFAAWGLILLLVAVYPANIHITLNPDLYPFEYGVMESSQRASFSCRLRWSTCWRRRSPPVAATDSGGEDQRRRG